MAERGEYRAIARVLLDGKDFQKLTERANHLFLALKISFGPAGIEVAYPEALRAELGQKTRIPAKAIAPTLEELQNADWIRMEGNVLWIIDQLRFDPHMKSSDWKHRLSIQRHIAGLPRLAIVSDYVAYYADWFVAKDSKPSEGAGEGLPSPSEGPSKHKTVNKTDDITGNKTRTKPTSHARARAPEDIPDGEVDRVILAANDGLRTSLGENFNPISLSHGSRQFVIDWLAEGVPVDVAAEAVRESAEHYKPNGRHRQINTMKYFDDAVHEAFDRERATSAPAKPRAKRGSRAQQPQSYDYANSTKEFKGLKV